MRALVAAVLLVYAKANLASCGVGVPVPVPVPVPVLVPVPVTMPLPMPVPVPMLAHIPVPDLTSMVNAAIPNASVVNSAISKAELGDSAGLATLRAPKAAGAHYQGTFLPSLGLDDLDGQIFIMRNFWNEHDSEYNKYVGHTNDGTWMRAVYSRDGAAPLKFHRVSRNTYRLENMWPGLPSGHSWVCYRNTDEALRSNYDQKSAAVLELHESTHGIVMSNAAEVTDPHYNGWSGLGKWISFADTNNKWLYSSYPDYSDAMPVRFERP